MGVASLFLKMFLRKLKNRSGSISIQIISKVHGKYKVIKTIGTGTTDQSIQNQNCSIWMMIKPNYIKSFKKIIRVLQR